MGRYVDTTYGFMGNTIVPGSLIGTIGMTSTLLAKIDSFLAKAFLDGKENGDGGWTIYIGEFADAIPELPIDESTSFKYVKRFLFTVAQRLAERYPNSFEGGEVEVHLWKPDEDDGEDEQCDLYDGSYISWRYN